MPTVTITAIVEELNTDTGGSRELDRKTYTDLDVMKTGQVRRWLKRRLNWHMQRNGGVLVARYRGQLQQSPFIVYDSNARAYKGRVVSDWDAM